MGYTLCDFGGDGVPELLIGTLPGDAEDAGLLYGGYTVKDGAIVAFLEGWARNRYQLLDDGCFYNAGSGGAMYSMFGAWRIAPGRRRADLRGLLLHLGEGCRLPGAWLLPQHHRRVGTRRGGELDMDEDGFWQAHGEL